MKKFELVLAFLASVSFTLFPVLPASAVSTGQGRADSHRVLVGHAARGDLIIVSPDRLLRD
jgi:hypothetical protein